MRLAAIDIGTNSVHMIVVRVRPGFLVRGRRPRKRDGPARRRRPRRQEDDAGIDERRAAGVVEVPAAGHLAPGGRDSRGGDQRHPRGRERRRLSQGDRTQDRHPRAADHRHRRSAAHPPGRGLRRRHAEAGGRHRHRRRQRRDHARHRPRGRVRAQLQDGRDPADRALRRFRSDLEPRRTQDGRVHQRTGRPLPRDTSSKRATTA